MTSDFPATHSNPFSLLNSVVATVLPTNILGGRLRRRLGGPAVRPTGLLLALNVSSTSTAHSPPIRYCWNWCPFLTHHQRRRTRSKLRRIFGTPLADALVPALSTLVNTGYTDADAVVEGGTYNRTYDQSGTLVTYLPCPCSPRPSSAGAGGCRPRARRRLPDAFLPLRCAPRRCSRWTEHRQITYLPATVTPPAAVTARHSAPSPRVGHTRRSPRPSPARGSDLDGPLLVVAVAGPVHARSLAVAADRAVGGRADQLPAFLASTPV